MVARVWRLSNSSCSGVRHIFAIFAHMPLFNFMKLLTFKNILSQNITFSCFSELKSLSKPRSKQSKVRLDLNRETRISLIERVLVKL